MSQIEKIERTLEDKRPLYVQIYEHLHKAIRDGLYKSGDQLPGENILSKQLGVSRSSLRQALLLLQEDGLIHNKRGKGTFVSEPSTSKSKGLENHSNPITNFLIENYDDVEITTNYQLPTQWLMEILQVERTDLLLVCHIIFKQNKESVCYWLTYVSYKNLQLHDIAIDDDDKIFQFINEQIYGLTSSAQLSINVCPAAEFAAEKLNSDENSPLILLEETAYMPSGEPLMFSKAYCVPENYRFYIMRH